MALSLELADVSFQSDWFSVLQTSFMRHAFIGGSLVALASGLIGYFTVVRQNAFAAHALAHIGFPGATGAVLIGAPITLGLSVFCIGGALVIGALGQKAANREVATGTVLAFATGLGVLFSSLSTRSTSTVTNILFGNLLAITPDQIRTFALFTLALAVVLVIVARPLLFASVDPAVAAAKGVAVRRMGIVFLVMLALVITMAVQVVGTLLLFALVVTPAATALRLSANPPMVATLGTGIGLASVWIGLVLSAMVNLPPSFFIVTVAFVIWLVTLALTRDRGRAPTPVHTGHHHPVTLDR